MKKDLRSKRFAVKKNARNKQRNLYLMIAASIITTVALGMFFFMHQQRVKTYGAIIGAHYQHVSHWIADRRGQLKLATNKNAEQEPIHFEFYSELPKIQVSVPENKPTRVG